MVMLAVVLVTSVLRFEIKERLVKVYLGEVTAKIGSCCMGRTKMLTSSGAAAHRLGVASIIAITHTTRITLASEELCDALGHGFAASAAHFLAVRFLALMVTSLAKMLSFKGCVGANSSTTVRVQAAFLAIVTREAISRHSATRVSLITELLLAGA